MDMQYVNCTMVFFFSFKIKFLGNIPLAFNQNTSHHPSAMHPLTQSKGITNKFWFHKKYNALKIYFIIHLGQAISL